MGGGIILVPALTFLGIDVKHAIAASMVSVIATSSGSAAASLRRGLSNVKIGTFLQTFTVIGGIIGASITSRAASPVLVLIFGIILLISCLPLVRKIEGPPVAKGDRFGRLLGLGGTYESLTYGSKLKYWARRGYVGGPLMLIAGLLAGMLGIGAGALKVLILDVVMGLPPKVSTTTSNYIIGITALAGSSVYLSSGLIVPGIVAPTILGVLTGSLLGILLLVRLKAVEIRKFFLVLVLAIGIWMIYRGMDILRL